PARPRKLRRGRARRRRGSRRGSLGRARARLPATDLAHRLADCGDDVHIRAAAAEIAAHALTDLLIAQRGGHTGTFRYETRMARPEFFQHAHGGADLTGSAVAALQRVMVEEGLLNRMKVAARGEAASGSDRGPVVSHGERQACRRTASIEQD